MVDIPNGPAPEINLAAQWKAERCPLINGIVFGDGRVKLVSADWRKQENGRLGLVLEPSGWTTLAELHRRGELRWTETMGSLCEAVDPTRNIQVQVGEGALGSQGFVACLRNDSGEIMWIAFFDSSNPFEVVQVHDDRVLAKTNLGTWWQFPLDSPDRVTLV
jgi:hypothetical protein